MDLYCNEVSLECSISNKPSVILCCFCEVRADGPKGPSALTLGNWMLLSRNG